MKLINTIAAASVIAIASAQAQGPTYLPNGTFTCPDPNGAYCAGGNIIIRCTNGIGQPGNCNDNLAGEPPVGVNYAPCWSCGTNSSRSACSKDGTVYPGSGAGLGMNSFSINDTSVCAAPPAGPPYANGTNPGGPIVNSTTPAGGASPSGTGAPGSTSSGGAVPYTGAATSVQAMGAGAVVGFGALFAALGMM